MTYQEIKQSIQSATENQSEHITLTSAAHELGIDLNSRLERSAFAKAIASHKLTVSVVPIKKIETKLRISKDKKPSLLIFNLREDPLALDLGDLLGFKPRNQDIEKVITNDNLEDTELPHILSFDYALKKDFSPTFPGWLANSHKPRHPNKPSLIYDEKSEYLPHYRYHEFYIETSNLKNNMSDEKIYLVAKEFREEKSSIKQDTYKLIDDVYGYFYPDPSNAGDYEINEWSNDLIKDLNCAFYHLRKINQNHELKEKLEENKISIEAVLKRWFKERWAGKKDLWKDSDEKAYRLISDHSVKINLHEFSITEECKRRNQPGATDAMILIDLLAESNFKKKRDCYRNKKNFIPAFNKAISVRAKELGHNIYSIAKAK